MKSFFLSVGVWILTATLLHAQTQIGLQADRFRWREFDEGSKLLEESGVIPGIFVRHNRSLSDKLGLHGELVAFAGTVHYDGGIQSPEGFIPLESRTRYTGLRADVDASYAFGGEAAIVSPFLGIGARYWLREIGRFMPNGYDEYWFMPYGRAGVRLDVPASGKRADLFATAAVILPFANDEVVKGVEEADGDIEVEPDEEIGFEAELGLKTGRWNLSAYWQLQDFGKSDFDESGQFLQPDSEMMIIGLRAGISF
ncbi:MAG: hypothetical protein NZ740_08940 [Kiritimatiellae bacterium]|nr:hypothetical protein [Kiritimatiellia bacterium]MDW8459218.1 hypothetical protein [Verrucomicrobiota bacterium]